MACCLNIDSIRRSEVMFTCQKNEEANFAGKSYRNKLKFHVALVALQLADKHV